MSSRPAHRNDDGFMIADSWCDGDVGWRILGQGLENAALLLVFDSYEAASCSQGLTSGEYGRFLLFLPRKIVVVVAS